MEPGGWGENGIKLDKASIGTITLGIMTFSIMTFSIMTFSIMTFSIMTFNIMTFSIMTLSMMTLIMKTLIILILSIMTYLTNSGGTVVDQSTHYPKFRRSNLSAPAWHLKVENGQKLDEASISAITFGIMTFSIMTLGVMTLITKTLIILICSIMAYLTNGSGTVVDQSACYPKYGGSNLSAPAWHLECENGEKLDTASIVAITLGIMNFSIMKFSMMALITKTLIIMAYLTNGGGTVVAIGSLSQVRGFKSVCAGMAPGGLKWEKTR
jgi:hypothetical protein